MQTMTIIDALTLAHNTLMECTIIMKDATKASTAMQLLTESINALRKAGDEKETENK